MSELCLVHTLPKTAVEIMEEHKARAKAQMREHAQSLASTRLVAKRFPDATFTGGLWISQSVNLGNADNMVSECGHSNKAKAMGIVLYVTLRPKGCEPVRVHSAKRYVLTARHVELTFQDNPKQVFKTLAKVLSCQETAD